MKKRKKELRVGIFGGLFDPIHLGHLKLAQSAHRSLKLDRVILVPAYISPFKRKQRGASATHRLKMVRLATKKFSWIKISQFELRRKRVSFSIDAIKHFYKMFTKGTHIFLLMGQDAFCSLRRWKEHKEILKLINIAVAKRSTQKGSIPSLFHFKIPMQEISISSTEIRRQLSTGQYNQVKNCLPREVYQYIKKERLYAEKP